MTHIELYKKYRPGSWKGLVGQQKVAKSLQSAVLNDKVPTVYVFAGERGCGKTSSALLLAKALNCVNLKESADPCNRCEFCVAIDNGTQLGVNYISMANKGSVDDIREIVLQARLSQPLKQQVWILDEVQNLSKAGFDALLIPLEEKDMPSLFILCTTAIEKVPTTILSRSQQRRFRLVDATTMSKYLAFISKKEELEPDEEKIKDAVRMGRGSVRDTLSAFEAILESGEAHVSYSGKIIESLSNKDISLAMKTVAEASKEGEDARDLAEQVFEELRNYLLLSAGVDEELVGPVSYSHPEEIIKGFYGAKGLAPTMDEIGNGLTQMSFGSDRRIFLEISLIKIIKMLRALQRSMEK